jgi:hypothetical protein
VVEDEGGVLALRPGRLIGDEQADAVDEGAAEGAA